MAETNQATGGRTGWMSREDEWARGLAAATLGWLLFEAVSGLVITFMPFSIGTQWTVLVHTGLGVVVLLPVLWYQLRHLRVYLDRPTSAIKTMGYLATAATLVAIASGLVLTWQAFLARRISYGWSRVHLVSTFALLAFVLPHVIFILVRDRWVGLKANAPSLLLAERRALSRTGGMMAACGIVTLGLGAALPGPKMRNEFPQDYTYPFGKERPFAPSLARTTSGGAIDPRVLSGSASCGTSGCHEEIVAEWEVSAHRWAAMDPGFQRIQTEMGKQNGAESTRYCGGCHDPISLFSGTKNIFTENLSGLVGYQEGVSCLACHSVRKTDLRGNANYEMAAPNRYLFEHADGRAARLTRDFLIRAYPAQHVADLGKRLFKTPEYCAACHKQFVDQEVNRVGWVQLQNQYDNWRKSRWNHPGDPTKTIECRECHMPLVDSTDPASGDAMDYNRNPGDRRHRSHRFVGANQLMPVLLKLEGGQRQVELTEKWLKGELPIPEIADKWVNGPAVALDLQAPERVIPGQDVALKAVITSRKVGHDFPTGPLDIIQSWVEIQVTDASGAVVFSSGTRDEKHFVAPGTFMFKAEPVDQYGNLIDRHNLWEMVGVRYRRSLFPGFSDTASYAFRCPGDAAPAASPDARVDTLTLAVPAAPGPLRVTGRLLYRKLDQYLLNFMFGPDSGLTAPVTEMARAETTITVDAPAVVAELQPAAVPLR